MADPLLNEILRRAVFAQAVQGLPTGFAPQPITFAPLAQQTPATAMQAGGVGAQDMVIGDGRDGGSPGGTYGATGYSATGNQFDNTQIANTPFGPVTKADVIGFMANLAVPAPAQLLSYATTGRTVGGNIKASLTPVSEASIAMSPAAFDLAQQIGITPAEAQSLINSSVGLAMTEVAPATADIGVTGGGGYGGYGGDTGGADTGGFGGVY